MKKLLLVLFVMTVHAYSPAIQPPTTPLIDLVRMKGESQDTIVECIKIFMCDETLRHINERDEAGRTALHWAVYNRYARVTKILLDWGADVSRCDNDGETPLHYAARLKGDEIACLLCQKGYGPYVSIALCLFNTKLKMTPLMIAAMSKHDNGHSVKTLAIAGPHDQSYGRGNTALHLAALAGNVNAVRALVEAGHNVNTCNKALQTPLFYAVMNNHKDVGSYLLDHGADMHMKDEYKNEPLDYAQSLKHGELCKILEVADSLPDTDLGSGKEEKKMSATDLFTPIVAGTLLAVMGYKTYKMVGKRNHKPEKHGKKNDAAPAA